MATNKKITELTELVEADLADDDVLPIVDVSAGETFKVRKSTLASALAGVASIAATTPVAVDQATGAVTVSLDTVPVASGGTGATTAAGARTNLGAISDPTDTRGDIITRGASALQKLGIGTSGYFLKSDGTDPTWAALSVDLTSDVTGTLPLANGGTNATTASGARTSLGLGTISTQAANSVNIDGGAIDGTTIGGSTAAAGTFTTLSASSGLDSTVIGGTTPAAGTFTTFTSTGIDDNASSTAITIDSSGNVGIGTASPSQLLQVTGVGSTTGSSDPTILLNSTGTGASDDTLFRMQIGGTSASNYVYFGDSGDQNAGMILYNHGSDYMSFTVNASERMRISSNGDVGIGRTPVNNYKLDIQSPTSDSTSRCIQTRNSSGTGSFYIRGDGLINTGADSQSPYNKTTAAAANMYVNTAGTLYRSTSSLRYKQNIQDAVHGLTDLLNLRPVTFQSKGDEDGGKVFGGLIAEEVHDAGLTEFVQYNSDDQPDALDYGNMVSLCIKAIQEQQEIIKTLEARVASLELK